MKAIWQRPLVRYSLLGGYGVLFLFFVWGLAFTWPIRLIWFLGLGLTSILCWILRPSWSAVWHGRESPAWELVLCLMGDVIMLGLFGSLPGRLMGFGAVLWRATAFLVASHWLVLLDELVYRRRIRRSQNN